MKTQDGFTPREFAFTVAIDHLRISYVHLDRSVDEPEHIKREMKKQLAKLHNKLLTQSGLDGLELTQ